MNYDNQLREIYKEAVHTKDYTKKLNHGVLRNIQILSEKSFNQKGVFTVFVTLSIYKIILLLS